MKAILALAAILTIAPFSAAQAMWPNYGASYGHHYRHHHHYYVAHGRGRGDSAFFAESSPDTRREWAATIPAGRFRGSSRARYHHWVRVRNERTGGRLWPVHSGSNDARARALGLPDCGAYMADVFGFAGRIGRDLWVAANWMRLGRPTYPHPGRVVAVWRHHVVRIAGPPRNGRWLVEDNHGRHGSHFYYRSLAGAVLREI